MVHGIEEYFVERARCARRVTWITLGLGLAGLALLAGARTKPIRDTIDRTVRFGYEGPDQYVRRITLRQLEGRGAEEPELDAIAPRIATRGATESRLSPHPRARPRSKPKLPGPGEADANLITRTWSRRTDVGVVRSEELVIDHLVRPQYPESMLEQNIEGTVLLQALVDTVGKVIDVQVMASSGMPPFEVAASEAVFQCRFRPYRVLGEVKEVYALFRFAFTIH